MANQRDWHKHHPHYYLTYRSKNPEYSERNRIQTRTRKSLLKSGLQNVLDISQLTDLSAQYCGTTRFAKCPPMTAYLLLVYKRLCTTILPQNTGGLYVFNFANHPIGTAAIFPLN